jgi:hypothetical protein
MIRTEDSKEGNTKSFIIILLWNFVILIIRLYVCEREEDKDVLK